MLFSVFTPTHRADHLADVWQCLREQTDQDWEWVVVPNGEKTGEIIEHVKGLTRDNTSKVRIIPTDVTAIGALKRFACEQCHGDVFVEYDHDDIITGDCLATLRSMLGTATKAFLFSDSVTCDFAGVSRMFNRDYGWRQYPWSYRGRSYAVNALFPITARSMSDILYSPDHVRAWTRAAYEAAGKHNETLAVGDDYDLMVRTYLTGAKFIGVNRPLYIHRLADDNTSEQNLGKIADSVNVTRNKYLPDIVAEWCRREGLPMYDLGGAHGCPPGYFPVDSNLPPELAEISRQNDMREIGWKRRHGPIQDDVFSLWHHLEPNSVGCFRAYDFLEHIPGPRIPDLMNMLYEKLVPGGFLLTMTPSICDDAGRCGRGAYQDPTHVSFWSTNNFWYYTDQQYARYVPTIKCRFQAVRLFNFYPTTYHWDHLIPYTCADLCAFKEGPYHPGPIRI